MRTNGQLIVSKIAGNIREILHKASKSVFHLQLEYAFSRQQKVSTSSTRQVGQQGSIFIEQEYPLRMRMKIMSTSHHNFVNNSTDLLMSEHRGEWALNLEQIFTEHFNSIAENLGKLFYFKTDSNGIFFLYRSLKSLMMSIWMFFRIQSSFSHMQLTVVMTCPGLSPSSHFSNLLSIFTWNRIEKLWISCFSLT